MSFFIKGKDGNKKTRYASKYKQNTKKRKLEKPKKVVEEDDEELSSESDEDLRKEEEVPQSSDEEHETAQEKKLRLAKIYLEEIEREELERLQDKEGLNQHEDVIAKRLKEDYLRQAGKLRTTVADQYSGVDETQIRSLKCRDQKNCITSMCVSPDNKFLYSGSKCGAVVKWCLKDMRKVGCIPFAKQNLISTKNLVKGHSRRIMTIAISGDGKFLAVGDESQDIQIWNPDNLTHLGTLKGHKNAVLGLAFRRDTHTLYSCSKDRSVKVWSLDEMAYVETLYGHQDGITAIDALSKERAITAGGRDSSLRLWKIAEESQLIFNGNGSIDCVRLVNEDNFVSGGDDGTLNVWSCLKKKPISSVKGAHGYDTITSLPNWITSVACLQNTDVIASGSYDGKVKLWKLSNSFRTIEHLFDVPVEGFVNSLAFTSDGNILIAGIGREHRFGRWNVIQSAKTNIVVIPLKKL